MSVVCEIKYQSPHDHRDDGDEGLGITASFCTIVNGANDVFLYAHVVTGSILRSKNCRMQRA
jgi:hypothetical protein